MARVKFFDNIEQLFDLIATNKMDSVKNQDQLVGEQQS